MGLCIRSGSTADGVEILPLTTEKLDLMSQSDFALNSLLFLAAWYFELLLHYIR
jgi:hypothetical protein